MIASEKLELLFLHALPLDGSMWSAQTRLLPNATYTPTLYPFGNSVEAWAAAALKMVKGDRVIVVGCSVGGSCALELAVAAPNRVVALVLIGTKAAHRPDPRDIARGVTAFHSRPSREQFLSVFRRPVIIVTGADDVAPGPDVSAAQAHLVQHGRLHIVPKSGHYVPLEQPECLSEILREVINALR